MTNYDEDVLRRLHETELEILDAIRAICDEEGLNWFLIGGSVLGAKRHAGFIPWDDDIDMGMLRDDYERFLEVAPSKLPPEFELLSPRHTPGYAAMFAKVQKKGTRFRNRETVDAGVDMGIFVDILPRDRVADDPKLRKRQYRKARFYTRASYLYHSEHISRVPPGLKGKIARMSFPLVHGVLKRVVNEDSLRESFWKKTRLAADEPATDCASFTSPSMPPLPIKMFAEPEMVSFEGRSLPAPNPAELYLETAYGPTWTQVPPPEKRKSHLPVVLDFGDGVNVAKA